MTTLSRHYDLQAFNAVMTPEVGAIDARLEVEGTLPEHLVGGTYYLNGPGLVRLGGRLMHPFDGHGYARAIRFEEGGAELRARFVDTPSWREESEKKEIRYRGVGTRVGEHFWSNMLATKAKNTANTAILRWGEDLLCLNEGGLPYALDPESLRTKGIRTFKGALEGMQSFLAHTRIDRERERLVGLSVSPGPKTRFTFFEIDKEGRAVARREHLLDGMTFVHDFAITDEHYLILENPVDPQLAGLAKMFLGMGTLLDVIRCAPRHARLIAVPRSGGPAQIFDLGEPLFCVHHANAYREGSLLVVDTCCFERFELGKEFGYQGPDRPLDPGVRRPEEGQRLKRFLVDMESGEVASEVLSSWSMDFPRVHPDLDGEKHRFLYAATSTPAGVNDPFNALISLDLKLRTEEVWAAGEGRFVGEPLFAPRPVPLGEDDGHVLAMVYDGQRQSCFLGVFLPRSLSAGPVAKVHMPQLLPYGFHGSWARG